MDRFVVNVTYEDNLLIECKIGEDRDNAIEVAKQFCKSFRVKCVLFSLNDFFVQVNHRGVVTLVM